MVKKAINADKRVLAQLAVQMWDSHTTEELEEKFEKIIYSENAALFIKYIDSLAIGFAQCGLRVDYVEGTKSSPVGYLEGVFIDDKYRCNGFAKELFKACEQWAKDKGCSEFASDCELDNNESLKFHMAMGFEEVNRIVCFRKEI